VGPTTLVVRAELRRRRASLVLLTIIVAVVVGTMLATIAGARRTSSVLGRFMAASAAHDMDVAVLSPDFALQPRRVEELRAKLAELDGVRLVSAISIAAVGAEGTQYDFGIMASPDGRFFRDIDRPIVVAGRLPAPGSVDEIAVNITGAERLGLAPGDTFRGPTFEPRTVAAFLRDAATSSEPDGPMVSAKVVGVVRTPDELAIRPQSLHPGAIASSSFFRANAGRIGFGVVQYALHVDRSVVALDDVLAVVRDDVGDDETFASWVEDEYVAEAGSAHRSLAAGLLVFAAVAGVVGLLAVFQAASRQLALSADTERVLIQLGVPRRQRALALGGPCAIAVIAGVGGGLVGAVLMSRWFPMSLARRAEIAPGFDTDMTVLGVGGLVATTALLAVVAWSAHRALRRRSPSSSAGWRALVDKVARWTGPAAGVGLRMALDPGRGERSVPARSALLGALIGVAGVVGAGVFVRSVATARDDPARYGWTWDSQPDLLVDDPEAVVARMVDDPGLAAVAAVSCGPLRLDREALYGCAFDDWKGSTGAPVTAGRAPVGPDEVALGRLTMDELGLTIGDAVLTGPGARLHVVGQAVIPMLDNAEPGRGALLTTEGLAAHRETDGGRYLLLTYAEGSDRDRLEQRLVDDYGVSFTRFSRPEAPDRLLQLDAMTGLLGALGAFLAVLGAAGLIHFLGVSVRRRRRDLAVLRSLGFARRGVRRSVSWQAVTIAALGVLAGVPLGVIAGRWAWLGAIGRAGIVDTPVVSLPSLAFVSAVAVGGAALVGAVPGWFAGRRPPADALRAE
jgi:hypothetical protein